MAFCIALFLLSLCLAGQAQAHASEQAFVLLLPTGFYVAGGVISVALTVLLIAALPGQVAARLFRPLVLGAARRRTPRHVSSLLAFALLAALVWQGLTGPHDPSRNLLPLTVWSLFWVAFVALHGLMGNLWQGVNPWVGPYALLCRLGWRPLWRLPRWLGVWPGLVSFLAFAGVLLVHPAPTDPDGLARMVAGYWAVHFIGMMLFGPVWRLRAEAFTVLLGAYEGLAPLARRRGRWRIGLPGWQWTTRPRPRISLALFMLALLAVGSFDGLNETFWWLALIGVNPLEFPGRSLVMGANFTGLVLAVPLLVAAYGGAVWLGVRLVGQGVRTDAAFCALAPAILPIAFGYHIGHYFPGFLVEVQYVARTLRTALHLGQIEVTTGFFNTLSTVRLIWLTQAGAVVLGHVIAIALGHALAVRLFGSHRKAALSQIPMAAFMVGYTLFGLWLLASPHGG
jgi:hypothetical protein